jgi:hypothetical protein
LTWTKRKVRKSSKHNRCLMWFGFSAVTRHVAVPELPLVLNSEDPSAVPLVDLLLNTPVAEPSDQPDLTFWTQHPEHDTGHVSTPLFSFCLLQSVRESW